MVANSKVTPVVKPRPLSPHLTIHRVQYTSTMSILHRISGFLLCFMILAFICIFHYAIYDFACFAYIVEKCISWVAVYEVILTCFVAGAATIFVASFYYHFSTGFRHLFSDTGLGYEKDFTVPSGLAVLFLAFASAVGFCLLVSWYLGYLAGFGIGS
jgi:succinate dehydrogenase / fumarate reductase cytochrome b subunit